MFVIVHGLFACNRHSPFTARCAATVFALGMLTTIAIGQAIDAYGPISDDDGGIFKMAGVIHRIREKTNTLDAAEQTTAAIGK
nr:pyrophosphatase [Tanacetum cinerariifolium]